MWVCPSIRSKTCFLECYVQCGKSIIFCHSDFPSNAWNKFSQILGLKNDHFHISETTDLSISGNDCYLASVSSRKRTKWLKYLHTVWNLQKFTILVKISWKQAGFLSFFGERLRDIWFHEKLRAVPTFFERARFYFKTQTKQIVSNWIEK